MLKFTKANELNLENLLLSKIPWTSFWRVRENFWFYIDYENKEKLVVIPKWFTTNMWSIPRLLWVFLNPTKYVSYILHDYIVSQIPKHWNRKQADLILIEWMNIEGASTIEKIVVYIWVRIGAFLNMKS
jgi:hypothetical protein